MNNAISNIQKYRELYKQIIEEYQKYDTDFSSEFLKIFTNGLTVIDILYLYEDLQAEINGDYCMLVANPILRKDKALSFGEIAKYEEIFPKDMMAKETILETLVFAEEYAWNYLNSQPGKFDTYKLMRFMNFTEVNYDPDIDRDEHIETDYENEILDFIYGYNRQYDFNNIYVKQSDHGKKSLIPVADIIEDIDFQSIFQKTRELYLNFTPYFYSKTGVAFTKREAQDILLQIEKQIEKGLLEDYEK